jgi:hypothetical protein
MVGIQCEFHSSFCLRTFRSSKCLTSFARNVPRNSSRSVYKLNLYIVSMKMKIEMAGQVLVKLLILNSVYVHEMGLRVFMPTDRCVVNHSGLFDAVHACVLS